MSTARPFSYWLVLNTLVLLCLIAVFLRSNKQSEPSVTKEPPRKTVTTTRQTQQSSSVLPAKMKSRNVVGGYSDIDADLLQSEEVIEIANFVLNEHASRSSSQAESQLPSSSLMVLPDEVESGAVRVKVLEARRQVVAGMNYQLTLAILRDNVCLGGLKVTVYKPLPHMQQGLTITSWGRTLERDETAELMNSVTK